MDQHKRSRLSILVLGLLAIISSSAVFQCQSQLAPHTLTLAEGAASPLSSLADVGWIAGHWRGTAFGGTCDEIWSAPEGNSMVGLFRLVKDGKAVFYELMTIMQENQSLVLKLKHFSPGLNGWEEKNESESFPLVKVGRNEAFFSSLTYRKFIDGSLQIFLSMKRKSGEIAEQEFHLQRVGQETQTSDGAKSAAEPQHLLRTHALKINVDNMSKALRFYEQKLGFEIEDRSNYPEQVVLKTGDRVRLILNRVGSLQSARPADSQVGLTLQVNDLDQAIARLKSAGVDFAESQPRQEAVGNAIFIRDPFGRKISVMHQTIVKVDVFKEPKIYNFGLLIPDMGLAREFYSNKLGFVVRSEKYLPGDLPLGHEDKSFGFMLHLRPGVQSTTRRDPRRAPWYTIVFETDNLQQAVAALRKNGIECELKRSSMGADLVAVFKDPFGNSSEIVQAKLSPGTKLTSDR